MRLRLIWRGILFDALSLLVNEKRGAGDFKRLSDLSGMFGTYPMKVMARHSQFSAAGVKKTASYERMSKGKWLSVVSGR